MLRLVGKIEVVDDNPVVLLERIAILEPKIVLFKGRIARLPKKMAIFDDNPAVFHGKICVLDRKIAIVVEAIAGGFETHVSADQTLDRERPSPLLT